MLNSCFCRNLTKESMSLTFGEFAFFLPTFLTNKFCKVCNFFHPHDVLKFIFATHVAVIKFDHFLMGQSRPLLCLFLSFPNDIIHILIDKSADGVLGTQTGRWKAQTNPLRNGGAPIIRIYKSYILSSFGA